MAKAKTSKELEVVPVTNALAGLVLPDTSLSARPDYLTEGDTRGLENITKDDMVMPRLALAQQMSPQLSDDDPSYIEDLKQGEFFNTLTKTIYGKGPVYFAVVKNGRPHGIEFMPREEGSGILDYNVPLNDPRMQFTIDKQTGKSVPPVATLVYDYVIMLFMADGTKDMLALSLKSSGIKTAKLLNGLMQQRSALVKGAPIHSALYSLVSAKVKSPKGDYYAYVIDNAGWVTREVFEFLDPIYKSLIDKNVVIDQENADDPFAQRDTEM